MKKITVSFLVFLVTAALIITGCDPLKKMADESKVSRKVTPSPLEMHAEKVPIQISMSFPPKYFDKNAYLIITPFLKSDDKKAEKQFKSQTLQGENVKDNNPIISFDNGGSYNYHDTIPYEDAYRMSDLSLQVKASAKGKSIDVLDIKVADGIITTPRLVEDGLLIDNGSLGGSNQGIGRLMDETVAIPAASQNNEELIVYYPLQQSRLTSREQRKREVDDFINKLKETAESEDKELKGISIASYASPDGPIELNEGLVDGRGKTAENFMDNKLKRAKIETDGEFILRETTPAEDWEGFKEVTEDSEVADKEMILRVLSMYSDPVVREKEIKNIAEAYTDLKSDVLPKLRRAEIKATYAGKARTKDEIIKLGTENSNKLSQIELFFAAQECQDLAKKETTYKNYTAKYPNDWKGHNNLGTNYIRQNKLDAAQTSLEKAESLESDNAAVFNNLGVLYFAKGDYEKAEEYFKKAKDIANSDAIGYNLGVIMIKQARYDEAVTNFGSTNTFNKSLAQLLNDDASSASTTINAVESDHAKFYYLKAIVAANNSEIDALVENLKKAFDKDESLKDYAKNDMEFFKFFDNAAFKALFN